MNLVEHGSSNSNSDHPVAPDPLVLDVVFEGELCYLGTEGVRIFHGSSGSLRHPEWFDCSTETLLCNNEYYVKC